jgi:AcrR family transcriptional regulator
LKKRPDLLAGEDMLPNPRQTRSEEKRERLKKAGLALFGERGYESTSIGDIARRANLAVGSFYQHYRSKRQLLLALMEELVGKLERLEFRPAGGADVRSVIRELIAGAFSHDLHYLGAYRAWQEAALTDSGLARKQRQIQAWTTSRVTAVFEMLASLPGARSDADLPGLAQAMDSLFWSLLGQAEEMPKQELNRWIDSCTHLIHHALFTDALAVGKRTG